MRRPFGRRPSGRSSTNGLRTQVSTFSCTTSLESANVAADSGTSSRGGIASRPAERAASAASAVP